MVPAPWAGGRGGHVGAHGRAWGVYCGCGGVLWVWCPMQDELQTWGPTCDMVALPVTWWPYP